MTVAKLWDEGLKNDARRLLSLGLSYWPRSHDLRGLRALFEEKHVQAESVNSSKVCSIYSLQLPDIRIKGGSGSRTSSKTSACSACSTTVSPGSSRPTTPSSSTQRVRRPNTPLYFCGSRPSTPGVELNASRSRSSSVCSSSRPSSPMVHYDPLLDQSPGPSRGQSSRADGSLPKITTPFAAENQRPQVFQGSSSRSGSAAGRRPSKSSNFLTVPKSSQVPTTSNEVGNQAEVVALKVFDPDAQKLGMRPSTSSFRARRPNSAARCRVSLE
eukprot:TRINITY_DN9136_c0_g1_i3.p1 TRINITY_DN9136_c0_g1~~TRINITY_DN9136_c0_g1_i3.p1  ORF type:complete len:314 (+),score=49.50 TRINITY_DN9136_c0_g1_i3:130-942(+)